MQGYVNPLVVKEINLPIPPNLDEEISLQEYKERYGIDLTEIMSFTFDNSEVQVLFKDYSKINLVYLTKGYASIPNVTPINACVYSQNACTLMCKLDLDSAIGIIFQGTSMGNLTIAGYEN